ncbi:hypothetical protein [Azospirillum canadense]|uniref:hypothetical protein n=1 Tax=Azospirillum canadense TaxID=403962 RepID=UPI0022263CBE|nr:hypothetical protein [Azospirillum canadense]MCW2239042.1 hypothetical protein [Azospirillum canadense]
MTGEQLGDARQNSCRRFPSPPTRYQPPGLFDHVLNGQISGIGTAPKFEAKDAAKHVLADHTLTGLEGAERGSLLRFRLRWLEGTLKDTTVVAAGHRVVHGGTHATSAPASSSAPA